MLPFKIPFTPKLTVNSDGVVEVGADPTEPADVSHLSLAFAKEREHS